MSLRRGLALTLATTTVKALSTRIFNVALPTLPSGGQLEVLEGMEDAAIDEDADSLAELFTVGGTVWPCAAAMCRWLSSNNIRGKSILELGGGTGTCGLYAAACGASRVVMTDSEPRLLKLMEHNAQRNMLVGNLPGLGTRTMLSYERYLWNKSTPPSGPFDLVIGSDCTYEFSEDAHADLAATLDVLLPGTADAERRGDSPLPRIVLAHQHRNRAGASAVERWDEPLRRFLEALDVHELAARQLVWERSAAATGDEVTPLEPSEGGDDISIVEVVRRGL